MQKTIPALAAFSLAFSMAMAQPAGSDASRTPFFNHEYCAATLFSVEGHVYAGLRVKLNLMTNQVKFVKNNSDEIELTISFRVKKIRFEDCGEKGSPVFQTGFPTVDRQNGDVFYQVLDSGKTMLLKYSKVIEKSGQAVSFNTGMTDITYETIETCYLYEPAKGMTKLDRSTKGVVKALDDKKEQVEKFIAANRIRCNRDEDLIKLMNYYNSLP